MHPRRALLIPVLSAAALVLWPSVASAHIEPDLSAVPAGAPATVAFNVEHGCGDDATTKLEIQVPAEITDAKAVDKAGWTGAVAGNVVTFSGGSQPAHEETAFSIAFTAPSNEGAELRFPIVQTCGTTTVSWIDPSEQDDHPTPVVAVGPAGSTPSTAAPDDDDEAEAGGTHDATTSTTDKDDSSSSAGPIALGALAVVVVVGGGAAYLRARRR